MREEVQVTRDSLVLADGASLEGLFDLRRRRVSARVFSDPEIFRFEMSRVFARSWLFMGLESEIPERGDYMVRPMGGDSVIVARDRKGEINIFLNRCAHRGTQLCVTDQGTARRFRCPYHGWQYGLDGNLQAMPSQRDWLGPNGDKSEYSLRRARVATRGGLVFGTWDEKLPDFGTYLGDFAFYFDMIFCSVDKDFVPVGPPQRWSVPFNWKLGAENFVGDTYHLQTAHASIADIGLVPEMRDTMTSVIGCEPRWGHGFFSPVFPADELPPLELTLPWLPAPVLPQLEHRLSSEQMTLLRYGSLPLVATVFPNMSWLASPFFFFVRTWQPVRPGEIELWTWVLTHPDATREERRARDKGLNMSFGVTGMFEQDDTVIWSRIQRMHESVTGSRELVSYACTNGEPGKGGHFAGGDWPGPGHVWQGFPSDDHIWHFHMRWLHLMRGTEV